MLVASVILVVQKWLADGSKMLQHWRKKQRHCKNDHRNHILNSSVIHNQFNGSGNPGYKIWTPGAPTLFIRFLSYYFYVYGLSTEAIFSKHFQSDEDIKSAVNEWLQPQVTLPSLVFQMGNRVVKKADLELQKCDNLSTRIKTVTTGAV